MQNCKAAEPRNAPGTPIHTHTTWREGEREKEKKEKWKIEMDARNKNVASRIPYPSPILPAFSFLPLPDWQPSLEGTSTLP